MISNRFKVHFSLAASLKRPSYSSLFFIRSFHSMTASMSTDELRAKYLITTD